MLSWFCNAVLEYCSVVRCSAGDTHLKLLDRIVRGATCRYTCVPPRCRTSQDQRTFDPLSVSLWCDLGDSMFHGVGLAGFKSRANAFLLA